METFALTSPEVLQSEAGEDEDGQLEFIFVGAPSGWTEQDSRTLERALDLAGVVDPAERLKIEMAVDCLGAVILRPLVYLAEDVRAQIRDYLDQIQGGIGR